MAEINYVGTLGLIGDVVTFKPELGYVETLGLMQDNVEVYDAASFASSLSPVTAAELTSMTLGILGYDPSKDSSNFITTAQILMWINDAIKKLCVEGRIYERSCFIKYTGATTISSITGYKTIDNIDTSLYCDVVDVIGVAFSTVLSSNPSSGYTQDYIALDRIRIDKYGQTMGGDGVTDAPPSWFGFLGQGNYKQANDTIKIYPTVTLSAGKYMYALVLYYGCPSQILTSGMTLTIPQEWHHTILDYVLCQARKRLGQYTLAMQHQVAFDNIIKWAKMEQSCGFFGRSLEDVAWPSA